MLMEVTVKSCINHHQVGTEIKLYRQYFRGILEN